jgi:hypothetical protein
MDDLLKNQEYPSIEYNCSEACLRQILCHINFFYEWDTGTVRRDAKGQDLENTVYSWYNKLADLPFNEKLCVRIYRELEAFRGSTGWRDTAFSKPAPQTSSTASSTTSPAVLAKVYLEEVKKSTVKPKWYNFLS